MAFRPDQPFDLPPLPPKSEIKNEFFVADLLKARTELGELNGYSHSLPNPLLLLSPTVLRESVASSNIENINTTIEQALQMQLFPETERRQPDKEVLRYHDAVMWGFKSLKNLPVSTRLILGIHKQLLPENSPGYRKTQNRIANSATGETFYTPPPAQTIPGHMTNWEKYVNQENEALDPIIQTAIAHYQFEAIHPFADGNGRVGRILMVLGLVSRGLLNLPILYISGYINKHRSDYYRLIREVTVKDRWREFIAYLLKGVVLQAKETKQTLLEISRLLDESKTRVRDKHKKIYSADLVQAFFAYPIITPVSLGRELGVNYRTASRYLTELAKGKVLDERFVGKYHLFINTPLLHLLKG